MHLAIFFTVKHLYTLHIVSVSYTHLDVYKRQEEEGLFMPDFDVTIVYEGNIETGYSRSDASVVNESGESMQASFPADSLYYEQDGICLLYTSRCV